MKAVVCQLRKFRSQSFEELRGIFLILLYFVAAILWAMGVGAGIEAGFEDSILMRWLLISSAIVLGCSAIFFVAEKILRGRSR